ncbi:MAG TPA: hypothetical protein VMT64_09115 [Candidatus Binataceae bacterium]|nr:hypothetical protein [Candidatus Binataceae bacterium]
MPDARLMSDADVRALAGRILARPEYIHASGTQAKLEGSLYEFLERIIRWFSRMEVLRDNSPILYWIIVLGIAAVCVALIAHVTWTLWIAMTAPEPASPNRISNAAVPDLAREAESLAQSGRYLDAAHRLMLASFRALAERSLIELRPDRSNRWIRAALAGSAIGSGLAGEIDTLIERTERRWFGDRAHDPEVAEIYARWRAAFEQLSGPVR